MSLLLPFMDGRNQTDYGIFVGQYLIKVVFFNQPYLKNKIIMNETITVTGKWDAHRQTITANEMQVGHKC